MAQLADFPIVRSYNHMRNAAVNAMTITLAIEILHLHHNWEVADALETYIKGYLDCMRDVVLGEYQANSCARSAIQRFSDHGVWRQECEDAWNSLPSTRREAAMLKVVDHVHLGLNLGLGSTVVPDDAREEGKEVEEQQQQQQQPLDEGPPQSAEDGSPDTVDVSGGGGDGDNDVERTDTNIVVNSDVDRPFSPISRYIQAVAEPRPTLRLALPRQHITFAGAQGLFDTLSYDTSHHLDNIEDNDNDGEEEVMITASSGPSRPRSSRKGGLNGSMHADDGGHSDHDTNQHIRSPSSEHSPGSEYIPSAKQHRRKNRNNSSNKTNSDTAKSNQRVSKPKPRPRPKHKTRENRGRGRVVKKDMDTGEEYGAWSFERVLDSRWDATKTEIEYRVQWTYQKPSWQSAWDLVDNPEEIAGFHRSRPQKPGPPAWFVTARP